MALTPGQAANQINTDMTNAAIDQLQADQAKYNCIGYIQSAIGGYAWMQYFFPGLGVVLSLVSLYYLQKNKALRQFFYIPLVFIALGIFLFFYYRSQKQNMIVLLGGTPEQQQQYCTYEYNVQEDEATIDTINAGISAARGIAGSF